MTVPAITPAPETGAPPLVTVITATYNRSNVLRYAIASLLASDLSDWELRVIGDACTDDTEAVVRGFGDPRIHFTNLTRNTGEQSGPNNEGLRQARGRYVAFLNHDDLVFPDHLSTLVTNIESTGADMVFSVGIRVHPDGRYSLQAATSREEYGPLLDVPASSWLFKRELIDVVGPWRFYQDCHAVPSQDWIYRAWRAGMRIRCSPRATVLLVPSGDRHGSYANRDWQEQQTLHHRLREDPERLRGELLAAIARARSADEHELPVSQHLRRAAKGVLFSLVLSLGISPAFVRDVIRLKRRGWNIDRMRKVRGLAPLRGR
jgi:glycosyltransferase involved in cell wall biosynthesis